MTLQWNGQAAFEAAQLELAKKMLQAAVFFQSKHRLRLNVSNPRPYLDSSREGEYPRARTGFGRDNVDYEPTTPRAVVDAGFVVRLGYRANAYYMAILEVKKKRLGLQKSFQDLLPQIRAVIGGT